MWKLELSLKTKWLDLSSLAHFYIQDTVVVWVNLPKHDYHWELSIPKDSRRSAQMAWNKLDVTHTENIDIFKTKLGEPLKELSIKF